MLVEIKPIELKRWHGKTGKDSFTRAKKIQALIDPETMQYKTGLDNMAKTYTHPKTEEQVTELEYYGAIIGKDLSPLASDKPHEFWDSNLAVVKLENNTIFLNTDNPLDYIKWKICKASKFVANSMKEYDEGMFPEATHVIFDEAEEIEAKATKVELRKKATIECSKLSLSKKIQVVMILGDKNLKNQSSDFVEVEIDSLIQKRAGDVLEIINRDDEDTALHAMILEALQKSVLRKTGHKIVYFDSVLGGEVVDVVDYLKKPENQDLKLRLMSQLNPK